MNKEVFINGLKEALEMDESQEVKFEDVFKDYFEWDSLAALSLIAFLDEEYEVAIETEQLDGLNTVQELFEYVTSHS